LDQGSLNKQIPNITVVFILNQLNYSGYNVIAKLALSGGINQLVFCVLRDVVALAILGPLAYVKDKQTRSIFLGYLFSFFFLSLTRYV